MENPLLEIKASSSSSNGPAVGGQDQGRKKLQISYEMPNRAIADRLKKFFVDQDRLLHPETSTEESRKIFSDALSKIFTRISDEVEPLVQLNIVMGLPPSATTNSNNFQGAVAAPERSSSSSLVEIATQTDSDVVEHQEEIAVPSKLQESDDQNCSPSTSISTPAASTSSQVNVPKIKDNTVTVPESTLIKQKPWRPWASSAVPPSSGSILDDTCDSLKSLNAQKLSSNLLSTFAFPVVVDLTMTEVEENYHRGVQKLNSANYSTLIDLTEEKDVWGEDANVPDFSNQCEIQDLNVSKGSSAEVSKNKNVPKVLRAGPSTSSGLSPIPMTGEESSYFCPTPSPPPKQVTECREPMNEEKERLMVTREAEILASMDLSNSILIRGEHIEKIKRMKLAYGKSQSEISSAQQQAPSTSAAARAGINLFQAWRNQSRKSPRVSPEKLTESEECILATPFQGQSLTRVLLKESRLDKSKSQGESAPELSSGQKEKTSRTLRVRQPSAAKEKVKKNLVGSGEAKTKKFVSGILELDGRKKYPIFRRFPSNRKHLKVRRKTARKQKKMGIALRLKKKQRLEQQVKKIKENLGGTWRDCSEVVEIVQSIRDIFDEGFPAIPAAVVVDLTEEVISEKSGLRRKGSGPAQDPFSCKVKLRRLEIPGGKTHCNNKTSKLVVFNPEKEKNILEKEKLFFTVDL